MHAFRDGKQRTWKLEIHCDAVEEIQEKLGVNVLDLMDKDSSLLQQLTLFPPLVAKICLVAISEQLAASSIGEKEWRQTMTGDALSDATEALLAEIINFSPRSRRPLLQAVLDKNREVEQAGTDLALARINDPQLTSQILAAVERRIAAEMRRSVELLNNESSAAESSASESSTAAGTPPDCSAFPVQDPLPGDS